MKYTCSISRSTATNRIREKVVLAAGPSEVAWHIALKVLGYILYMEEQPRIEAGVGWRFKPDLVVPEDGYERLWIDCGNIGLEKIGRVAARLHSKGQFIILRRQQRDALQLVANANRRMTRGGVTVRWFDDGFVDDMAQRLDTANTIDCQMENEMFRLSMENRSGIWLCETKLHSRLCTRNREVL